MAVSVHFYLSALPFKFFCLFLLEGEAMKSGA